MNAWYRHIKCLWKKFLNVPEWLNKSVYWYQLIFYRQTFYNILFKKGIWGRLFTLPPVAYRAVCLSQGLSLLSPKSSKICLKKNNFNKTCVYGWKPLINLLGLMSWIKALFKRHLFYKHANYLQYLFLKKDFLCYNIKFYHKS